MRDADSKRRDVAADYARAVTGAAGCCHGPGVVARLAGYADEDFAVPPADAANDCFRCGNPRAFSAVRPGQVVLDLGSGAGIDLLLAARRVGPAGRVIGVEVTEEAIARVLRPGGTMLVSEIVAEEIPAEIAADAGIHLRRACLREGVGAEERLTDRWSLIGCTKS